MAILKRVAAALLACAAAGCEFLREPTTLELPGEVLQVHSVLRAGTDTVKVLVERSGASGNQMRLTPVSGARIQIAGGGSEVSLAEAPAGFSGCVNRYDPGSGSVQRPMAPGCYAAVLPGGVRAGERYLLSMDLTDGTRVTGETVVPPLPEIVRPTERERLPVRRTGDGTSGMVESLLVRWRLDPAVSASFPTGAGGTVYSGGRPVAGAECGVTLMMRDFYSRGAIPGRIAPDDSTHVNVQVGGCRIRTATSGTFIRPDSVDAVISIDAQDSAVVRHLRTNNQNGIRDGRASQGLRGAYGLFGSTSSGMRRVRLVFTTP